MCKDEWLSRLQRRIPMVALDAKQRRIFRNLRVVCVFAISSMELLKDFAINR